MRVQPHYSRRRNRIHGLVLYILAAGSLAFFSFVLLSLPVKSPASISGGEIHWHARLRILVNGMNIPVPAGIGLGKTQEIQHTHDWDGVIHIEGLPTPDNLRLGKFFDIWGVVFNSNCIFQYCNEDMKMFVNGRQNFEFDSYLLRDGDEILITVNTF
jgi:hypothetical protein